MYTVLQAARSHTEEDRLYIDDTLYTIENLDELPFDISYLHEKKTKCATAFLGRFSGFSYFYRTQIIINDVQDSCSEQYLQAKKAKSVGNTEAEITIMMANDPVDIKYTDDNIKMTGARKKNWDEMKELAMREALMAKTVNSAIIWSISILKR